MNRGINTFTGGLDKDTSPAFQRKETYTDAWNVRLITDEGSSNGALINLKGNELRIEVSKSGAEILYPIGWGMIRDVLYLFVVESVTSQGRIYKVVFNESANTATTTLIYSNNDLNWSVNAPIGKAVGRYETSTIQRLYWTDGVNPIRTINVVDPNIASLTASDLNLNTSTNFIPFELTSIEQAGGNLTTGVYYYTYRLKASDGQTTPFAPIIGPVNITEESDFGSNWKDIEGGDTVTEPVPVSSKYVKLTINNQASASFNIVECVYIYQNEKDGTFDVNQFAQRSISPGTFNISHFGNENDVIPVTLEEISGTFATISTAKTIEEKDNRLFIGNVTSDNQEIDNWDATVYRYNISGQSMLSLCGTSSTGTNYSEQQGLYKYKSDGITLGAEGANVSVTFDTTDIRLEGTVDDQTDIAGGGTIIGSDTGYSTRTLWGDNNPIPIFGNSNGGLVSTYGSPMKAMYLKGYQRGEFYRFGIIFYDLLGNPSFVKWIGDIKMPEMYDTATYLGSVTHELTEEAVLSGTTDTTRKMTVDGKILYPVFEVDVSAIEDKISAYSIVRVERDFDNSTILAQGTLNPVQSNQYTGFSVNGTTTYYRPFPPGSGDTSGKSSAYQEWQSTASAVRDTAHKAKPQLFTLDGPDVHFSNGIAPVSYLSNDYLKVVDVLKSDTNSRTMLGSTPVFALTRGGQRFGTSGYYDTKNLSGVVGDDGEFNKHSLSNSVWVDSNSVINDVEFGQYFINGSPLWSSLLGTKYSPTLVCGITGSSMDLNFSGASSAELNQNERFLVNYIRPRANQYGGPSEESRTTNDYITTGHYQVVDGSGTYTNEVLGGDTYVNWYGYCKTLQTHEVTHAFPSGSLTADEYQHVGTYFQWFPVESKINTDLRRGGRLGKLNVGGASATNIEGGPEEWIYNPVYSSENKATIYTPKPFDSVIAEEFDTRIFYTQEKVAGNTRDDWSIILLDDYHELESKYGPLNRLIVNNDVMYAFQDRGISVLNINPRALLQSQNTSDLVLGSGAVIDSISYIANNTGSKHRFGVGGSNNYVYFVDVLQKKIKRIGANGIEELLGLNGILRSFLDGPIEDTEDIFNERGVSIGFDSNYDEILITLMNKKDGDTFAINPEIVDGVSIYNSGNYKSWLNTIVFNERTNSFTSRYSVYPNMYIETGNRLLYGVEPSRLDGNIKLYEHNAGDYNKYCGNRFDTRLSFISNDSPGETKVFDNLVCFTEVNDGTTNYNTKSFNKVKCKTGYQNSGYVNLTYNNNIKRKDRGFSIHIPRNIITSSFTDNINLEDASKQSSSRTFKERMRDKYMNTELVFSNILDYRLVLHYIETLYRKSYR